jgi:hypothetical protein
MAGLGAPASFIGGPWDGAAGSIPEGQPPAMRIHGDRCLLGHWHQFDDGHYELCVEEWVQTGPRQLLGRVRYRWVETVARVDVPAPAAEETTP